MKSDDIIAAFYKFANRIKQDELEELAKKTDIKESQIANISLYGNGTAGNPYVLDNYQVMPISSLFEEFNDYAFPVYNG